MWSVSRNPCTVPQQYNGGCVSEVLCPYYDVPGSCLVPDIMVEWPRYGTEQRCRLHRGAVSCDVTIVTSGALVTPTSQQHAPTITSNTFPCLSKPFNLASWRHAYKNITLFTSSPSKLCAKTKVSTVYRFNFNVINT